MITYSCFCSGRPVFAARHALAVVKYVLFCCGLPWAWHHLSVRLPVLAETKRTQKQRTHIHSRCRHTRCSSRSRNKAGRCCTRSHLRSCDGRSVPGWWRSRPGHTVLHLSSSHRPPTAWAGCTHTAALRATAVCPHSARRDWQQVSPPPRTVQQKSLERGRLSWRRGAARARLA